MTQSDGTDYLFTSESVTEGHPDKIADQISDAVVDAALAADPGARVACETLITTGLVVLAGEITAPPGIDYARLARDTICRIGYDRGELGFDGNSCAVLTALDKQSPDIAQGVDLAAEARTAGSDSALDRVGAGDQGMMFGYATSETPELMPLPIALAHRLARRLAAVRKDGTLPYLRPDGKTQVSVRYSDGRPVRVEKVLISTQHAPEVDNEQLRADLWSQVVTATLPADRYDADLERELLVNPTGRFVIGGPVGDAGLTGRKIIVDTYGGFARHGGGAFSGKDPSKVDRSAAYAARYVAKNLVAAGLAARVEVQVAYAIGVARPDYLMTFPGRFREQLIDGQLDHVSLSFLVDDLHIYRGGVGGNVAFGLGRLGFGSYLVGAVGADFADYRHWLGRHLVNTRYVHVSDTRHTARFLCTTDADSNQIASFYAGAMAEAGSIDLGAVLRAIGTVDLVVIAPNDPDAMVRHTRACRDAGVRFAADPSQQLARMDGADIRLLVDGAELLFTNEYERDLLEHKTGWSRDQVLARVGSWVTTFGAKGLEIRSAGEQPLRVGAHQDLEPVDPTGVGDACRAGFLAGRESGLGMRRSAEIGCTLASFVLESVGTQEYTFDADDFASRVAWTYGADSATDVRAFLAAPRRTDQEETA